MYQIIINVEVQFVLTIRILPVLVAKNSQHRSHIRHHAFIPAFCIELRRLGQQMAILAIFYSQFLASLDIDSRYFRKRLIAVITFTKRKQKQGTDNETCYYFFKHLLLTVSLKLKRGRIIS